MSEPLPTERPEHELVAEGVDRQEWGPTEDDEEQVLRGLYGEPDADGIYRGGDGDPE